MELNEFIHSKLKNYGYLDQLLKLEETRQENNIELIASENYCSDAVRAAMASCLTNKYAEGYAGKRYYGGCQYVDEIEKECIRLWKLVFDTDYHVNVQPHSGSQANFAALGAFLKPGDTIMSLDLAQAGHLTHGSPVNFSGTYYNVVNYGLDRDGWIDYNDLELKFNKFKPKVVIAGASAYSRFINFKTIKKIIGDDAIFMVDMAHIAGIIAAGYHQSPFDIADVITTTTHKTLRGPRGGLIFCKPEYAKQIDKAVFPFSQGGPLEHVILAKAVCAEEALSADYKQYIHNVLYNARAMAEEFIKYGYEVVTGGTDNHMFLISFIHTHPHLTGLDVQVALDARRITVNKNCVPGERWSPMKTSGIRIGTPAMTTCGWTSLEFIDTVKKIDSIIQDLKIS